MHLSPGTILHGNYRIVRFINSGGFGCTYEAEHIEFGERFAIKEFFWDMYCTRDEATGQVSVPSVNHINQVEKLRERFRQEAVSIRKLNHNNIVNVADIFQENGTAYYVMDYIDGQSLKQIVEKRGVLSEQEAIYYINQIASALDYIHSKGLLHLDIKPANIMVDTGGKAILIDFGASKMFDAQSGGLTQTMFGHTNGYASPEQMNGEIEILKTTADIYSLGATFYNLLTGKVPQSALSRLYKPLEPLPANVSAATASAIKASLELSLEKRPQTISEFLAYLSAPTVIETTEPIDDNTVFDSQPTVAPKVQQKEIPNGKEYIINGVKFNMIRVDGGTFTRKKKKLFSTNYYNITIDSYYIAETQVTQELWEAVMGSNPSKFKGKQRPVEKVSYDDCITFIECLNDITGENFRLPTEAEWEFAVRGGNNSHGYEYSGSDNIGDVAWYNGNSAQITHDVKGKIANELGLYDMSGNVWEWCSDWFGNYPYVSETNPKGPKSGSYRVLRGGSWFSDAEFCSSANRNYHDPYSRHYDLGFRLAQ